MKKMMSILSILFLSTPLVSALNPADFLRETPEDFKPYCYEFYQKIDRKNFEKSKTYKLSSNKIDIVATQFGFILPFKKQIDIGNSYTYKTDFLEDISEINDENRKTYFSLDIEKKSNELLIELDNTLKAGEFQFEFDYFSEHFFTSYFISTDNVHFSQVTKKNISDFDLKYLKIEFWHKNEENIRENVKIYELNIKEQKNIFLIKSFYDDDIELYAGYKCSGNENNKAKPYEVFPTDIETTIIQASLSKNPKYNIYTKSDKDNDWIEDSVDNCISRYNPDQKDSNSDGIGDMCSDDDNDGYIGYYDNCPNISNPDQEDINRNFIGDVCEFDKDGDGIFDSFDVCINVANPDQKDDDGDKIGNECDNCSYYNPTQRDEDNNGIGDVCDQIQADLLKNDSDLDGIHNKTDNCTEVVNPDQEDSDGDGVGDACDNCKLIQNKDQWDHNNNSVGDTCEDSDEDGIIGYLDNCLNHSNPDQQDDDNNGIGNICEDQDYDKIVFIDDNCPFKYNKDQKDIDADGIGDVCDTKDNRFIESNKGFFTVILLLVTLVFSIGIFSIIKKLK